MSSTHTATAATYRKTKTGQWVVMADAAYLRRQLAESDGLVKVEKRSGETKIEQIAKIGKPFKVGAREMAYGYIQDDRRPTRNTRRPTRRQSCDGDCATFGHRCSSCGTDNWR